MNHRTTIAEAPMLPPPPSVPLQELIVSLEQAALMAKQLPSAADPNHLLQIYSSLHQTHHHLSSFISHTHHQFQPCLPLPLPLLAVAENSLSSATAAAEDNGNEPMQVGDDGDDCDADNSSKVSVDKVEERMRDCFIKNKRPKRPLSPSSAVVAEERRLSDDGCVGRMNGFDPYGTRLRALDLVYQFHG